MSDIRQTDVTRWVVLASAFFVIFLEIGLVNSYGILLNDVTFQLHTSSAVIGLAIGVSLALSYCLSVVTERLMHYFAGRWIVLSGCVIGSLGFILSSFSQSATHFVLATLLTGIGNSLVQVPSYLVVIAYFTDPALRKIATSIYFTGVGVGMIAVPPITSALLKAYGWRNAILLLGGIAMNSIVFAALLKDLHPPENTENTQNDDTQPLITTPGQNRVGLLNRVSETVRNSVFITHPLFTVVFIAIFLYGFMYNAWIIFVVPNAIAKGFSQERATFVATIGGVANVVGGLVGFIAAKRLCSDEVIFSVLNIISASALYFNQVTHTYWGLCILSVLNGLDVGAGIVLLPLVTDANVPRQDFPSAFAYNTLALGLGGPVGGAVVGKLFDVTKSLDLSFIVTGIISTISAVLLLCPPVFRYCHRSEPM